MSENSKSLSILFVCTGNTCRSVFAEYLMKKLCPKTNLHVASAGIDAQANFPIPNFVTRLLAEEGINEIHHTPKKPTQEMMDAAAHIYAMEEHHKEFLIRNFPKAKDKVSLLTEKGISDPIGGTEQVYRDCLKEIKEALIKIMKSLEGTRVP